jgi:hypothetical protein
MAARGSLGRCSAQRRLRVRGGQRHVVADAHRGAQQARGVRGGRRCRSGRWPRRALPRRPRTLLRVANVLGIRRAKALVAATFGQVHGRYARGGVHVGLEVLGDHQAPLMDAGPGVHGCSSPGGSGSSNADCAPRSRAAPRQSNSAPTRGRRDASSSAIPANTRSASCASTGVTSRAAFDPRAPGREAENNVVARAADRQAVSGSGSSSAQQCR